ncbi:MAG: hypothetical protein ACLRLZ_07410 [Parasutterella excrementihominis]|uniref:hypothetical protein n=1 Tax=Parasutterella excrementihominis TaxID=487175 RepID=UPI0039A11BF1
MLDKRRSKSNEQAEMQLYGKAFLLISKAAVLYGQAADLGSPKAMMRLSALMERYRVELSQESFELIQSRFT